MDLPELMIILVILLLLFGSTRLPSLARSMEDWKQGSRPQRDLPEGRTALSLFVGVMVFLAMLILSEYKLVSGQQVLAVVVVAAVWVGAGFYCFGGGRGGK